MAHIKNYLCCSMLRGMGSRVESTNSKFQHVARSPLPIINIKKKKCSSDDHSLEIRSCKHRESSPTKRKIDKRNTIVNAYAECSHYIEIRKLVLRRLTGTYVHRFRSNVPMVILRYYYMSNCNDRFWCKKNYSLLASIHYHLSRSQLRRQ